MRKEPYNLERRCGFRACIQAQWLLLLGIFVLFVLTPLAASAHRSGCHRWHSCPSDTESYVCGDLGYPCRYPTFPSNPGSYVFRECTNVNAILERVAKENKELEDAKMQEIAEVNANPWISEGLRLRKIELVEEKYLQRQDALVQSQLLYPSLYKEPCEKYVAEAYRIIEAQRPVLSFVTPTPQPQPRVLQPKVVGTQTVRKPALPAKRINSLFRKVYGRNPTPSENLYWRSRIKNKPLENQLVGAMKWHKTHRIQH